ncbi:E3 ubiquitin-protein ligase NEURL3 [Mugil cephalus]|uniref:E3 ubiquitin-protein ligase NEURL3 n=1 Tax=Mugil cephalus TaxID=48193 RepID=UPI001FB63178|nr:E3 ubiquitin-protein ligase NEURL3 [Mugil cephalus]
MVKETCNGSSVVPATSHRCGPLCLGPLTFHHQAVGDKIHLSHGRRLAERTQHTFRNGLVFSSRPVKIQEKVRVRVQRHCIHWNGALRVGFTNVPPQTRSLPLPSLAIPDITNTPGHWAAPVPDSFCRAGSELEFWVTSAGKVYITINNRIKHKLLKKVDVTRPLWAMIDVYGQTCSIFLLGSEKKHWFYTQSSCPAALPLPAPDRHPSSTPGVSSLNGNNDDLISRLNLENSDDHCCVCMVKKANITLPCGHRCLCNTCTFRVTQQFGTCPLCRHEINFSRGSEDVRL